MLLSSGLRLGVRTRTTLAVTAALAWIAIGSSSASAAGVDVKLPYGIAYDLSPIQIEVAGGSSWSIYDLYKNEVAQGTVEGGSATIAFRPPKYGWYAVECGTKAHGSYTSGVAKFIGVTPKFPGMPAPAQGEVRGGWNDEALQAFSGILLDRARTKIGFENAERVVADAKKYGVTLLMQFEGPPSPEEIRLWVSRFKGRIKYWEVMNEPNGHHLTPPMYFEVLKNAYPAIKSMDPEAVVMGPGTYGIDLGWYEGLYKAGGGEIPGCPIHPRLRRCGGHRYFPLEL